MPPAKAATMEALAPVSMVAGALRSMPTLYRLEVSQMVYKTQKLGNLRQLRE
jgi:hypothetical protein